ncbi:MAG: hypothetical protein IJZ46_02730 [Bacilli bacterium]|nr:hypothetical protein [Bacilli bacterium]
MQKIIKWMKKNIGLTIILSLTLILLIILTVILIKLLAGGSSNTYGNRLEGIEEVKISNETYEGVKTELSETELVEESTIRLQGKIVYTTIVLNSDVTVDKAKELASNTLDNYSEAELSFYDFSFFLKWKGEEEDKVLTGNKHHSLSEIAWVKS